MLHTVSKVACQFSESGGGPTFVGKLHDAKRGPQSRSWNRGKGLLRLIAYLLLRPQKRQSRQEESSLVDPNKRRRTQSGAFGGATRRAEAIYFGQPRYQSLM